MVFIANPTTLEPKSSLYLEYIDEQSNIVYTQGAISGDTGTKTIYVRTQIIFLKILHNPFWAGFAIFLTKTCSLGPELMCVQMCTKDVQFASVQ